MSRCPRLIYTNKRQVVAVEIDPKCKSIKFWEAKNTENLPSKVSASKTAKTALSSITSKSEISKLEKKFNEALKKCDAAHEEDLRKMQTNFDLQLNKMKSHFETANATINNKIVLIQNDVSSMDSKLDTGFTNTQSLIAELSQQLNQIATTNSKNSFPGKNKKEKIANT